MKHAVKRGMSAVDPPHFVFGTQKYTVPLLSEVLPADRSNREARFDFEVELAGAVQGVIITGVLVVAL